MCSNLLYVMDVCSSLSFSWSEIRKPKTPVCKLHNHHHTPDPHKHTIFILLPSYDYRRLGQIIVGRSNIRDSTFSEIPQLGFSPLRKVSSIPVWLDGRVLLCLTNGHHRSTRVKSCTDLIQSCFSSSLVNWRGGRCGLLNCSEPFQLRSNSVIVYWCLTPTNMTGFI